MDLINYFLDFYVSQKGEVITPELAQIVVKDLAVTDGTLRHDGEKWTLKECKAIGNKYNLDWNEIPLYDWYVVLNKAYSLFYQAAKHLNQININFFAEISIAWFYDVNGNKNQTFNYICKV